MSGYWKVPRYERCVCFLIKLHSIQQLNTSVNGVAPILLNLHVHGLLYPTSYGRALPDMQSRCADHDAITCKHIPCMVG